LIKLIGFIKCIKLIKEARGQDFFVKSLRKNFEVFVVKKRENYTKIHKEDTKLHEGKKQLMAQNVVKHMTINDY
jgi:hypothetical protein